MVATQARLILLSLVGLVGLAGSCHGGPGNLGSAEIPVGALTGPAGVDALFGVRLHTDRQTALDFRDSDPASGSYVNVSVAMDPEPCTLDESVAGCGVRVESVLREKHAPQPPDWRCDGDQCFAEVMIRIPGSGIKDSNATWALRIDWDTTVENAEVTADVPVPVPLERGYQEAVGSVTLGPAERAALRFDVRADPTVAAAPFAGMAVVAEITGTECATCDGVMGQGSIRVESGTDQFDLAGAAESAHLGDFDCSAEACTTEVLIEIRAYGLTYGEVAGQDDATTFGWKVAFHWLAPAPGASVTVEGPA